MHSHGLAERLGTRQSVDMPRGEPLHAADALVRAVQHGIEQLHSNGVTNEAIAGEIYVAVSTVGRWARGRTVINRENAALLASKWPAQFPDLVERVGEYERQQKVDKSPPALRVMDSVLDTYQEVVTVLEVEDVAPDKRIIRHCAFHGERGRARRDEEDLPAELRAVLQRFDTALTRRIHEGWHVQELFSVGSVQRLDGRVRQVALLEAPALEVRAFPASPVPLLAPFIIGDQAFVATDNQRWHRAEAGLKIEGNSSLLNWLHRYLDTLWDLAPYRLRDQAGPNDDEFARLRRDLDE